MPNKPPPMKLSRDEELFLRRWIYDEWHYREGQGPAKRLQLQHEAASADLAAIAGAAIPDPADQEAIALGPAPEEPSAWPWTVETLGGRVTEARDLLARKLDAEKAHIRDKRL